MTVDESVFDQPILPEPELPTPAFDAFQGFLAAQVPHYLRIDAPPATWTGTAAEWEYVATLAQQEIIQRAALLFANALVEGLKPEEMVPRRA